MARPVLHRPVDNPLRLEKLPPTRPQMEWPVRTRSLAEDRSHAELLVLGLWLTSFATLGFYREAPEVLDSGEMIVIGVFLLAFASVVFFNTVVIIFGWAAVLAVAVTLIHSGSAHVLAVLLVLVVSHRFRKHYQYLAAASPLDRAQAQDFRKRRALPAHLRRAPLIPSFRGALVSWFTYNRDYLRAPGIFHSPAGSYGQRLFLSVLTVSLLTLPGGYVLAALMALLMQRFPNVPPTLLLLVLFFPLLTLLPLIVLLLACILLGALRICAAHALIQSTSLAEHWVSFNESIRTSSDSREQNSLFLGLVYQDGSPVLLPIEILHRHGWLVGSTGAGKTTYLIFLLEQVIARGWSVVYVDLKATDYGVLETFRQVRQRTSWHPPLKYLTNRQGCATHVLCPFSQSWWPGLSSTQKTDVLLAGLGLAFSRSYGESYFTDAAYAVLDHVNHKYPDIGNFQELAQRLAYELVSAKSHELSDRTKQDGEHVRLVIDRLAQSDLFNLGAHHSKTVHSAAVDLSTVFAQPSLVYCAFSSLLAPTTSPENARVTVSSLLTAATIAKRSTPVLLVIDEFQQMVAPGTLQLLLRQSRSLGISVILTNQTVDDLKAGHFDLTSTVEGNTSTQAWFKVTDQLGIAQLNHLAGKVVDTLQDMTPGWTGGHDPTVSIKQVIVDRLLANDIVEAASVEDAFFLRITDSRDYAQYAAYPFLARSIYHLTKKEYDDRMAAPWPAPSSETIVVGASPPPTSMRSPPPKLPQLKSAPSPVINTGLIRPAKTASRRLT